MGALKNPLIPALLSVLFFIASCGKPASGSEADKPSENPSEPAAEYAASSGDDYDPTKPILIPDDEIHPQYAGSGSCYECHQQAYELWEKSNHGMAERPVSKEMDGTAFTPRRTLKHKSYESETFLDADGVAKILTTGLDGKREYEAVRVIGHDPLRQFLIPAPGGRMQVCDVSYEPATDEWFNVYEDQDEERHPGDWGAWTGQGMNWNAMCAACHNTRLRKHYDPQKNSYHTTMAEMTVGCEACHGPMADHVEWHKNPPPGVKEGDPDPTIKRQTRDQMLHTCAACHARRGEITGDLIPGENFYDHFSLVVTDDTDTYYPDGQVRDEDYVFAAFSNSTMHHVGIRCGDCHEPHSNKRLIPGNLLCMRCHGGGTEPPAPVIDPLAHSHHQDGSTGNDCTNCHMPQTTYMARHPRRDHGFTIPDPLLTKEFGIPNACNRCHTEEGEDVDWAIKTTEEWYGEKMNRPTRTRARMNARGRQGDPSARPELIASLKTEKIAAWRATACHLLIRWSLDEEVITALIGATKDESPLVREAAIRTLNHPIRQGDTRATEAMRPLLEDPIRSVRVAAAWALIAELDLKSRAGRELTHMLDLNSDQPTGRMQLSQFAYLRGDTKTAIKQIEKAVKWDPNSPPFHHDHAILLSTTGDIYGAIKAMKKAIELDPDNPEYQFKIALAYSEVGNLGMTIQHLEQAIKTDPTNGRAWYNLGLAYNSNSEPAKAIGTLTRAETAAPDDPSIPYAAATIHARLGQKQEALQAASRALQIQPNHPQALQLIQALGR